MAFENFNIQLTIDINEARSELKKFQSEAKARVAELQKQFDKLVLPSFDSSNQNKSISDIFKNVNATIKKINDLKKSIGDINKKPLAPAKPKELLKIEDKISSAKAAQKTLLKNLDTPGALATLDQVNIVLQTLGKRKREITKEIKGTVDEISKYQIELKKSVSDPAYKAAVAAENKRIADIRAERAVILQKQKELMDQAKKEMSSREILMSLRKNVKLLKEFTKAAVDEADSIRVRILSLKQEIAQATRSNSPKKGDLENKLKSLLSELAHVQEIVEYSKDELETLSEQGADISGKRRATRKRSSRTNTRSVDNPENAKAPTFDSISRDPKVTKVATEIVDDLREAFRKGFDLNKLDLSDLVLRALQKIEPKVSGQRQVGIALRGMEKDSISALQEELSHALKVNNVELAQHVEDLITQLQGLTEGVSQYDVADKSVENALRDQRENAIEGTKVERNLVFGRDAVLGVQGGDPDFNASVKASNEFIKELTQMLQKLGGKKIKILSDETMKAQDDPEYIIDIATSDKLLEAFTIALETAKQINEGQAARGVPERQRYAFGVSGRPENMYSSPFPKSMEDEGGEREEEGKINSRLKMESPEKENKKTLGLKAYLRDLLSEEKMEEAGFEKGLIDAIKKAISEIKFKDFYPISDSQMYPKGENAKMISSAIDKIMAEAKPKTSFNEGELKKIFGDKSPMSDAILKIIQEVSNSIAKPQKAYTGYDPEDGTLYAEFKTNIESGKKAQEIIAGLSDVQVEFLELLEFINQISPKGTPLNSGARSSKAAQEEFNLGLDLQGVTYPVVTMFEELFNALPEKMNLKLGRRQIPTDEIKRLEEEITQLELSIKNNKFMNKKQANEYYKAKNTQPELSGPEWAAQSIDLKKAEIEKLKDTIEYIRVNQAEIDKLTESAKALIKEIQDINKQYKGNTEEISKRTKKPTESLLEINNKIRPLLRNYETVKVSPIGAGLSEQTARVVKILKDLSKTFTEIYGSSMKETINKKGRFNELGLPDDAGQEMTFIQAFIKNVRGYYNDLIKLNSMVPALGATKKEAVNAYWRDPNTGGVPSQNVEDMLTGAFLGSDKPYSPDKVKRDIEDISRILEDLTALTESGAFAAMGQLGDELVLLSKEEIAAARAAVQRGKTSRKYTAEEQFLRTGSPIYTSGWQSRDADELDKKYGRRKSSSVSNFGAGMSGMESLLANGLIDGINKDTIQMVQEAVKYLIQGAIKGLTSSDPAVQEAGAQLGKDIIAGFEGEMGIESPSKRMAQAGKDTVDGLEDGLFDGVARLDKAGRELAETFHTGWSESARVNAVELIQQLEKEGTDAAKARIQKGLEIMRSAPPSTDKPKSQLPSMATRAEIEKYAEIGRALGGRRAKEASSVEFTLSSQEEIQKRNEKRVAILDEIIKKEGEILLALDIESTGVMKNKAGQSTRNRVFGYSMVAGGKEESDQAGMLPGSRVVMPSMAGIAHGMVVPPKDLGELFSPQAAEAIGLKQYNEPKAVVLQNLIKRIEGLGYPAQNITGSEQEYVKQLEDIAFFLRKVVEEKIPLAIHNAQLSDITALGKEFAHYGITAPTGGQLKDAGLLVETQSFGKMFEGFFKDAAGKVSLGVGNIYKQLTGKEMGSDLIPKTGDIPQLTDKSAVAHDPTIDTAATLVNAFSMRKTGGNLGMSGLDLFGKTVQMFGATWQKVSDAIWGKRKYDSKEPGKFVTGDASELQSFKRQAATRTGQLQPIFVPGTVIGARPVPTPAPTPTPSVTPQDQGRMDEAQSNVEIEKERADLLDKLDKERQKREKEHQAKLLQWETDKIEELMSQVKNIASEIDKPSVAGSQGMLTKEQLAKDLKRIKDEIAKKYATIPGLEDSVKRQLQIPKGVSADNWIGTPGGPAAGGVRTLFFAGPKPVNRKTKDEKAIEDRIKQLETKLKEAGIDVGNAGEKVSRGPNTPIAAPLDQLTAAEEKLRASIVKAAENNLGEELVARLKKKLSEVEKSIKAGSIGKRGFRDASGQLTSAEVDVFKVPEGVLGVKQRVAPLSRMKSIKTELAKQLTAAQEKGRTDTVAEITRLLQELDKSIASGPVGKYHNGKDAYEIPDAYRKRGKQEKISLSLGSPEDKNKAFTHSSNIDMEIAAKEKTGKQFSGSLKGELQDEVRIMAQVEKYNRKMMDSWISGRYALYDVANTYQQFNRILGQTINRMKQSVQIFAQYETAFTSVERALQPLPDEFEGMRNEVIKLTNSLPIAFDELSRIQTLGAQMGIKPDGITNFTEQVSKFSAITGIASDTVAQKFGRISQLAKVPSEDFNKLGSAVAYAGVNAVATDEEILTLTENISAAATNSGFAADEIIGLSTAMASLGIAPEQARGVITRLFGDINRAIEGGGQPLNAYAKHIGLSAEKTKELWKTDPQGFFKKMLDSLARSKNLTVALDALNIRETREVSTLQKLSGNMDVYNQAMADAQESYANGSFLGDAYAKTQDNIASKLEIISNKIKMLQDSFGEALLPILAPILDGITKFLDGLNAIANNPIGKWAIVVGSSLIAMLTAFTSVKMISMKATASLLAFRTAQMSLSKIGQDNTGIVGFFNALTGREKLIIRSNGRIEVSTRNAIKQMVKMGEIRIAKRGSEEDKALSRGHDARRAGMASTDALYAERDARKQATLTSNEDTIATLSNGEAKRANSAATKENASASNAEVTAKNASVLAVQQEIIAIDAEIGAKQARLTVLASERAAMSINVGATETQIIATNAAIVANEKETLSIQQQIAALEEKRLAAAGAAKGPEVVKQVGMLGSIASKVGMIFSAFSIGSIVVTGVLGIIAAINESIEATKVKLEDAGGGLASFREAIYKDTKAYNDGADAYSTYTSKIVKNKSVLADWAEGLQDATNANGPLTSSVSTTTEEIKNQTLALSKNSAQWLANAAMQDDVIQGMFKKYYDRGSDLGTLATKAGTKISDMIIAALAKPGTGAVEFLKKFNALSIENGTEVYNDLMNIANSLDATVKSGVEYSKTIQSIQGSFDQFNTDDINDGLDDVKNKVYTLTNYVADLSTLMSDAFTIRFGKQESTDKLESSWKAIGDRLEDARKEMQAINQEISSMTADKNILEYQLSIALQYGDTLRADKIRAELAAKQSEIEGKQTDLIKASDNASTSLVGINPAAIQNRETMRSMVQDYQTQLASLANEYSKYTGKTQKADRARIQQEVKNLKADFKAKAIALGFSEEELKPYLNSFSDWKTLVEKLPNQLTVKVVADPGMRAWLEWWAANKDGNGNVVVVDKDPKDVPDNSNDQTGNVIGQVPTVPDSGKVWTKHQGTKKIDKTLNDKLTNSSTFDRTDPKNPISFLQSEKNKAKKARDDYYEATKQIFGDRLAKKGINFTNATLADISDANGFNVNDRKQWVARAKQQAKLNRAFSQFSYKSNGDVALTVEESAAAQNIFNQLAKQLPSWVIDDINILKQAVNYKKTSDALVSKAKTAYENNAKANGLGIDPADWNSIPDNEPGKGILKDFYTAWKDSITYRNELSTSVRNARTELERNGYNYKNLGFLLGNTLWKSGEGFASGGYVSGRGTATSDSIPAMLSNGEYVLSADTVNRVGIKELNALNSGVLKLANGGVVNHPNGGNWWDFFVDPLVKWWQKYSARKISGLTDEGHGVGKSIKSFDKLSNANIAVKTGSAGTHGSGATYGYESRSGHSQTKGLKPSKMGAGGTLGGFLGGPGGLISWANMADGGYISGPGTGRSDSIPLWASNGEYMAKAKAVNYYGLDFMNAINQMQVPRFYGSYSGGGSSSRGSVMVELSPRALMQLMALSERPINLYSDDRQIASSANRGNMLLAMRGAN